MAGEKSGRGFFIVMAKSGRVREKGEEEYVGLGVQKGGGEESYGAERKMLILRQGGHGNN